MPDAKELEQLNGVVESVVFHNETNGFSVLTVNAEGELISCVGCITDACPGEELTMEGRWDQHAVFGRQFRFQSCRRSMPDTTGKLYRYLASGAVKGIGPKTAMRIIERFGDRAFDVLESEPEKLAVIKGISKQRALELSAAFKQQFVLRQVMLQLEGFGISPLECTRIIKAFGANAMETIRDNPYSLCSALRGFGFDRAEKLCADMDLRPAPLYRNRAGLLYIIEHNLYANGHTCIPFAKIEEPAKNLLGIEKEEVRGAVDDLISVKQIVSIQMNGEEFLFLASVYNAEHSIAEKLNEILRFPNGRIRLSPDEIGTVEEEIGLLFADRQKEAIQTLADSGMLILTGGPGTGKTTTVQGVIRILERHRIRILLCAPTGMAARRLSEVTGREAKTIHRMLEVEWDDDDRSVFRKNKLDPLDCGALIVDEMSMVDVELFSALLDALPAGCKLILIGDSDQLPSVGPGNVLGDLIASGRLPVIRLNAIFRQAQKSMIVVNAHRIIEGQYPILERKDADFFFMKRETPAAAAQTVSDLITKRLPEAYGFSPVRDIQILCPSKKGDCGTVNINRMLQAALNPRDGKKGELSTPGGRVFREGDRVMQIRNNYEIEWTRDSEIGTGIFNGDTGVIEKINFAAGEMRIRFDDRLADYPADNLSELELAYSVTVHKSQGNEYPAVILPLIDTPPMLMYRNLLYTAVTRAKKLLILVGSEDKIRRMTENNRLNRRYSALKEFLAQ